VRGEGSKGLSAARLLAIAILLAVCGEIVVRGAQRAAAGEATWAAVAAGALVWLAGGRKDDNTSRGGARRAMVAVWAVTVLVLHCGGAGRDPAGMLFSALIWACVLITEELDRLRSPRLRDRRTVALAGFLAFAGLTGAIWQLSGATPTTPGAPGGDPGDSLPMPRDLVWLGQAEDLVTRVAGGEMIRQPMKEFDGQWSGGVQAFVTTASPGAELELSLPFSSAVEGRLLLKLTGAADYGKVEISWPGAPQPLVVDTYSPLVAPREWLELSSGRIEPGVILLRNVGRSDASAGFQFGVDAVAVAALPLSP